MHGAQIAVEVLEREGVTHVFGLPGTTIMHLIDAFAQRDKIRYISTRHEQVAAFMADGYARASGRIGVCIASRGPGAANLTIGVHNAHAESVPVLAVVGQVADEIYHREAFEEMDLVRFFEPVTKWSLEIHTVDRIPELMQRAIRVALSGRPGPVMVSLPLDVQTATAHVAPQPSFRPPPPSAGIREIEDALGRLADAERPVVVLGGGIRGATYDTNLIKFVERLQIPVVTTWLRKNVFPNDSSLFCGSLGYGAFQVTDELVREADVVLALGCRFSEFTTKRWSLLGSDTALIQVDVDPDALGRYYVPTIGICADAAATTAALLAGVDALDTAGHGAASTQRRERAAAARTAYLAHTRMPAAANATGVSSQALIEALRTVLGRTPVTVVQDAPSMGTWIQRYLEFTRPGTFYAAGGGSMGWGFPAAMGMQLARPDERFLTVSGDGSFWMVAQDLETAVRENLPIVNVINNNFAFGNTRDRQRVAHGGRYHGVFYNNPDFAQFARLLGAHGERVTNPADLVPALDRAIASNRPAVIDVLQDHHEGLPPDLAPPAAR